MFVLERKKMERVWQSCARHAYNYAVQVAREKFFDAIFDHTEDEVISEFAFILESQGILVEIEQLFDRFRQGLCMREEIVAFFSSGGQFEEGLIWD